MTRNRWNRLAVPGFVVGLLLAAIPASAVTVGEFVKLPTAQKDKALAETRDAVVKKINAVLLS